MRIGMAGCDRRNMPGGSLSIFCAMAALAGLLTLAGCASVDDKGTTAGHGSSTAPLRVAVTGDYPPLVTKAGTGFQGAEIDLAHALGQKLGRPVEFVPVRRGNLIPALVENQADIIMSGMSVTTARQLRIAFTDPYLRNELRAVFPRKDADRFKTPEDVMQARARIGVITGTTADVFVQKNCPEASRVPLESRRDAAFYLLKGGRLDLFIDDSFALAQMVSENEADLAILQQPLAEDDLAWGLRPGDQALLDEVNAALAGWKADGTLSSILRRWMPYLEQR